MRNNKKIRRIIGLDLPDGYLEHLEKILYNNGLFKENNALYLKGQDEAIDYDLSSVEYARFYMEYSDMLVNGKCTNPIKIFKTFKVVFDFFQAKMSPYRTFLLKDPSLIDDTPILSIYLAEHNLLESVLNTLDIVINKDIIELYHIHGLNALRLTNSIPIHILDTLELMEKISNELYSLIMEHSSQLDFSGGRYYNLKLFRNMVVAEEIEDIRNTRYMNIINKSKEILKDEKDEDSEIIDEHLDMLFSLKNEDKKYENILLSKLVCSVEKLEEPFDIEYRQITRPEKSINKEVIPRIKLRR